MLDMQLAVHMNPGSYVISLAWVSSERTSISFPPKLPCRTGNSYYLSPIFSTAFSSGFGSVGRTSDESYAPFIKDLI